MGPAKTAAKQDALVNTLDLIEVLPPGLYAMILEAKKAEDVGADLLPEQYLVRLRRGVGGRNQRHGGGLPVSCRCAPV